jgi:hypothetical protein
MNWYLSCRFTMMLAIPLVALGLAITPLQASADYQTPFTSDEYPPIGCQPGEVVSGAYCTGAYCDNSALRCAYRGYAPATRYWTGFFSEEGGPQVICPNGGFITGLACKGDYCDNLALECTTLAGHSRGVCYWTGDFPYPTYSWGGWLSEERGELDAFPGYYAAGVQCRGDYCDDKQFYMCPVQ